MASPVVFGGGLSSFAVTWEIRMMVFVFSGQCQSQGWKDKKKVLGLKYEVLVRHFAKKQ